MRDVFFWNASPWPKDSKKDICFLENSWVLWEESSVFKTEEKKRWLSEEKNSGFGLLNFLSSHLFQGNVTSDLCSPWLLCHPFIFTSLTNFSSFNNQNINLISFGFHFKELRLHSLSTLLLLLLLNYYSYQWGLQKTNLCQSNTI